MQESIELSPKYVSGSFLSRAKSISLSSDKKTIQNACIIAAISSFIKVHKAKCFASPEHIIEKYNLFSSRFGLKEIKRSTFFAIQSRVIELNLIIDESEYNNRKGRHNRFLSINFNMIKEIFSSVYNLAFHRASCFIHRIMDSSLRKKKKEEIATKNISLSCELTKEKRTILTNNISKDIIKDKKERSKMPHGTFFCSRFKSDADSAYQLQTSARNGCISAGGAKKLISLHVKHNVYLKPSFLKFLQYRILNFITPKPAMQSNVTVNTRVNLSNKKIPVLNNQRLERPAHMTLENVNQGISIRDRIKRKINNTIA